jgi:glycosyltransferase involved in cell wall biosynthesis
MVSVVMPVLNEEEHLATAVESVLAQRYPGTIDVCLAVGPSRDRTAEVAADLSRRLPVTVVANPTGATPAGLNLAIAATRGEVVVRVDAHSRLPTDYIATAVHTLLDTGAVNVGGRQHPVARGGTAAAVARAMTTRFGTGGARFHVGGRPGPVDTVYLGVFRRAAGDAVGWFDERLVRNQDYELNIRLRAAGGTVWFDPRLSVEYSPRDTLRALARQYAQYGWWKAQVARLHPSSLRARQAIPALVSAVVATGLVAGPWWPPALLAPLGYAGAVVLASATSGRDMGEKVRLVAVYPVMHLAWGIGFLASWPRRRLR